MLRSFTSTLTTNAISSTRTVRLLRMMQTRALVSPGTNPLQLMLEECRRRHLCDEVGFRLPGVHWTFAMSFGSENPMKSPILRTINIQRLSENGIDVVVKGGSHCSRSFVTGQPVSILHLQGKYVTGEQVEQWRAEGHCVALPLLEIIDVVPEYTLNVMVSSKRLEAEMKKDANHRYTIIDNSHVHEIVQTTRLELATKTVSHDEIARAVQAFRFHPNRMERMSGGPDTVLWDRWEWLRASSENIPEGHHGWDSPTHLMPH